MSSPSLTDAAESVLYVVRPPAPFAVSAPTPLTASFKVAAPLLVSVRLWPPPVTAPRVTAVPVSVALPLSVTGLW